MTDKSGCLTKRVSEKIRNSCSFEASSKSSPTVILPKNLSSLIYAKKENQLVEHAFQVYPLLWCDDKPFDLNFEIVDTASLKQTIPSLLNIDFSFQSKICGPSSFDGVLNINIEYE